MNHATEVRLIEKILTSLEENQIPMEDDESRSPVSNYCSEERFKQEVETLFKGYPIIVGHSSQVRLPGDFITHDLAGISIVVVRSQEGKLNGFLNVCRHRGTQLVTEACGSNRKAFVCPYHAWTYDTDGKLIHIPLPEGFPSIDREQFALVPIPVESKAGFIWVKFTPHSDLGDMARYLGPVAEDLDSFSFDSYVVYRSEQISKSFNWKIGIDIFLESYHFRVLHRRSSYPIFFDTVGIYDRFYPHLRLITPKRKITRLAGVDRSKWQLRPNVTMAYYIFPNTFMFIEQHLITVFTVFPAGIDHATIAGMYLVSSRAKDARMKKIWDANIEMLWAAAEEDFMIGESLQKGLRSGANTFMNFGRYEKSLDFFHSTIEEAVNSSKEKV